MVVEDLKNKIEALLFSSGKKLSTIFIAGLTGASVKDVENCLASLVEDYKKKDGALMVFNEGSEWKISIKEAYVSLARKIVADTELSRSVLETLAVIAWKSPVLQSEVVKVRSNKAYDHIAELETLGFIAREKKGRSFLLKPSDKFYQYFDVGDKKSFKKLLDASQKKLGELDVVDVDKKEGQQDLLGLEVVELPKEEKETLDVPKGEKIDWNNNIKDKKEAKPKSASTILSETEKAIEELAESTKNNAEGGTESEQEADEGELEESDEMPAGQDSDAEADDKESEAGENNPPGDDAEPSNESGDDSRESAEEESESTRKKRVKR